jgi:hypothetical protein
MRAMLVFAIPVFLSALLLFFLEPLIGKALLPWFGGTPNVWSSCLLFFQVALLGGYLYSHALASRLAPRHQVRLHLGLLAATCLALGAQALGWGAPLLPGPGLKPPDGLFPVARVMGALAVTVGLPFFSLSATGPLLQAWFARTFPGRSAYRLYALSNAGSFLGLLGYPFAVEPALALRAQGWLWTGGFAVFCGGMLVSALRFGRRGDEGPAGAPPAHAPASTAPPGARAFAFWTALAACPSMMLLAVTAQLSQEVAASPFLWVLPLAVYLSTFILCFESDRWYTRARFVPLAAALLLAGPVLAMRQLKLSMALQIGGFLAILFAAAMVCHGELARRRPAPEHLTRFYLALSLGGAVGGVSVPLIAPLLWHDYFELDCSFLLAWLLVMAALAADRGSAFHGRWSALARGAAAAELLLLILLVSVRTKFWDDQVIWSGRNFYGRLQVSRLCDTPTPEAPTPDCITQEVHGRTVHGWQVANAADPRRGREPLAYYGERSGIARALSSRARRTQGSPMRVGVIGLGAGMLAAYGRTGDVYRFYEINPQVVDLARLERGFFSFLGDSPAHVEISLGDARLALERELGDGRPGRYEIFVVDAFSSDSVPTHLLTREALELYKAHLAGPESIVVIHVTNRFLDLVPLVWSLADAAHLACTHVENVPGPEAIHEVPSAWMLLSPSSTALGADDIARGGGLLARRGHARPWTDDYTSVLPVMRWTPRPLRSASAP